MTGCTSQGIDALLPQFAAATVDSVEHGRAHGHHITIDPQRIASDEEMYQTRPMPGAVVLGRSGSIREARRHNLLALLTARRLRHRAGDRCQRRRPRRDELTPAVTVLSVRSVENRLQHVYEKLAISGRAELTEALRAERA